MKRAGGITIVWALCLPFGALVAQQVEQEPDASDPRTTHAQPGESTIQDLANVPTAEEPHEHLAATVGTWSLTIRVWSSPEGEPAETKGTAEGRWILSERFVHTTYLGEVMGQPFEALKIEGYEKASKEYVGTWRDSLGSYTLLFRGSCADGCMKRTMHATFRDPVTEERLKIRGVTTLTGADSYSYESYIVTPDGSSFKNMELVAERQVP